MTRTVLSNRQIARAALLVVLGFLASGVLGLVRTGLFSITFGAGEALDAYYAAQRIPETLYVLVAGGALGSSFIPVFTRAWAQDDAQGAWRLASAVLTLATGRAGGLARVLALRAPGTVPTLRGPGAPPRLASLTTGLTQFLMITVIIFTVSGLLMGMLNARQRFVLPALALSMNNLGQIFGALVLVRLIPAYGVHPATTDPALAELLRQLWPNDGGMPVYGLAAGAALAALLHLAVQLPGLPRIGARLRVLFSVRVPGVREVLLLMLPRVLGLAVVQLNFAVNVILTSSMLPGSRTALVTAWTLMFFVLGVIAQSIGTAVFPSLAALGAAGDIPGFRSRLSGAMRGVLFLAFPASVALITLGGLGIRLLFQHGEWSAENTEATAWALAFFALGVAGHGLLEVLARAFYALEDTWTPVLVGVVAMAANITLSLLLISRMGDPGDLGRGPFAGLALANSLTTLAEAAVLWLLLRRRLGGINDRAILRGGAASLLAALGMGAAIVFAEDALTQVPPLVGGAIGLLAGALVFLALAVLFRLEEARTVPAALLRRFRR